MKPGILITTLLSGCFALCFVAATGLDGKWTGSLLTADSTAYPLTYNFTLIGDSVAGTAKSTLGEFPIDQGKLDTAGLHFKVTVNGLDVYHNGIVYTDSIGMNISLNGSVVHCTLNRTGN
ncbi:hypothetical protein PQ469_22475 [Mucilaginibacter sp. KACC 22773]|uniref:hypothetical protein n=1 Tax=Mucilaginibacter sp. KACC 22773 TaxID=3025671 RepID=UPI00236663F2|nr:hypothetical protein [Mucilaginibacter sp. KACC 22773]WDF76655.1 hypothetical protein PQ469_22475 [Mucilaginibacter sp. KACC 22773]